MGKAAVRPLDFVRLARQLEINGDDASRRAAARLAYYGAFHFSGERLERLTADSPNPIMWTGENKNHGRLREQWRTRMGDTGYSVANALLHVHELRKKADYDLHLDFTPEDREEAFGFVARILLAVRRVR